MKQSLKPSNMEVLQFKLLYTLPCIKPNSVHSVLFMFCADDGAISAISAGPTAYRLRSLIILRQANMIRSTNIIGSKDCNWGAQIFQTS